MFESAHQSGLRFECQQCSSCCSGGPGYVWLSEADISLLANHLNLSIDIFIQTFCRFVEVEGGKALSLRERKNYDCIFLEGGRCSVYEARPVQCRRYPFWEEIIATEEDWEAEKRYCPGVGRGGIVSPEAIADSILEMCANQRKIFTNMETR